MKGKALSGPWILGLGFIFRGLEVETGADRMPQDGVIEWLSV